MGELNSAWNKGKGKNGEVRLFNDVLNMEDRSRQILFPQITVTLFKRGVFIIVPLLIGILIYTGKDFIPASPNLLMNFIKYNLTDLLWSLSFIQILHIIWKETALSLLVSTTVAFFLEIGQALSIIKGTYDVIDMISYVVGSIIGLYTIKIIEK